MISQSIMCIGHRGAKGHLPENTLPSFQRAIDLGCNWVELDVYVNEGELVVIHDKTVDRTTNGTGEVMSLSLAQLRNLDAGNGAKIPTLQEVISLVDHRCGINIELKGPNTAMPTNRLLSRYCESGWTSTEFLISSFNLNELAQVDKAYRRGALFSSLNDDVWAQTAHLDAWSVNIDAKNITEHLVEDAHQRGYRVLAYTVNSEKSISQALDAGVDGVFSDFPDRVLRVMAQRGQNRLNP